VAFFTYVIVVINIKTDFKKNFIDSTGVKNIGKNWNPQLLKEPS
jgi:hypothetical protein